MSEATPDLTGDLDAVNEYRNAIEQALNTGVETAPGNAVALNSVESAVAMKRQFASVHKDLTKATAVALEKQKAAKQAVEQKKRELEQMMRDMEAELAPLQKKIARMEDGMHAMNLYLGRGEEIITVRDGELAPAGTPIHIRQMTLAMDEEAALHADEGGLDFQHVDVFINWLNEDQAHIDQLIPELKGVVAIQPRLSRKEYDVDAFSQGQLDAANAQTFWLLRNGDALWLTTTSFYVGKNLIPKTNEFTSMFVRRNFDGTIHRLTPGSREWLAAEEHADYRTRHYMKVALILQGLIDRTKVFHPLPAEDVSFLEQESYDRGVITVVTDAELSLTTGRPAFYDWLEERNEKLTTGMRVAGAFTRANGFRFEKRDYEKANVKPEGSSPEAGVYTIKRVDGNGFDFSFTFDRQDQVWDRDAGGYRPAKTKGTAYFNTSDRFIVPIETVTIEDIDYYLNARTERHAYITMFPILLAAKKVLVEERKQEKPFVTALTGELMQVNPAFDADEARTEAQNLVTWYRTANKWGRALTPEDGAAFVAILTEAKRRHKDTSKDATMLDTIRDLWAADGDGRNIMVIARRTNDYIAVIPETRKHPEAAVSHTVFVTVNVYSRSGKLKETKRWVNLTHAQTGRWTILENDDRWSTWTIGASLQIHLTDDEIDSVIEHIRERENGQAMLIRWSETGEDGDRERLAVTCWSKSYVDKSWRSVEGTRKTDKRAYVVTRKGQDLIITRRGALSTPWENRDDAPWARRYWGEIHVEKTVWEDTAAVAAENALHVVHIAEMAAVRERRDLTHRLVAGLDDAWENQYWEDRKREYVDDFGDDELWEEHKKTLRHPKRRYLNELIGSAVRQLVDAGTPPYGRTVGDLAEEFNLTLPDDVLTLTFADAPETGK